MPKLSHLIYSAKSLPVCQVGKTDIRNIEIFQPSFYDQRKGRRGCYPLAGRAFTE